MKRKIISIITVFTMFLPLLPKTVSAENVDLSGGELLKQYILSEKKEQNETILKELSAQDEAMINAEYLQSYIESNEMAKESYGGCYIDDNQKLHILFTKNVVQGVIDTVDDITRNTVMYENCKYTLEELIAIKNHIENFMNYIVVSDAKTTLIADEIVSVGIREADNRIFVGIKNCSEEKIEMFKKKICSSDAIDFGVAQEYQDHNSVKPGGVITTDNGALSTGFRCKVLNSSGSYNKGFVTAAHGTEPGDSIYFCGAYMGYVHIHVYGGYVDAAFVHVTNVGCEMSNTTFYGSKVLNNGSYISSFATGATVYKDGFVTGETSGQIISTSETVRSNTGQVVLDCVVAAYNSTNGDSGGVVFMHSGGKYHVAGIHKANSSIGSAFVKVKRIKEALGVILY